MLKILKPKIIFVDGKFKITLNNNVMKIIRAVRKKILLYSRRKVQETDFLNGDSDDGSNGKVTESCNNDGADVNDVGGGDGKGKVDYEVKEDGDDGDNDKTDCDDDADAGRCCSKDDGDEDGIFENWCVDGEGDDEADDGDEQTESVGGIC